MNRNRDSIDGFSAPKRRRRLVSAAEKNVRSSITERPRIGATREGLHMAASPKKETTLTSSLQQDIKESLENLSSDNQTVDSKRNRKFERFNKSRRRRGKKELSRSAYRFRIWRRRIGALIIIALLIVAGVYAYRFAGNITKTFNGDIFSIFQKQKLQQDSGGRTNILIFGTSPEGWDGADLADSIMVVSYNQEKKDIYTVSLPRDLYVKHSCANWLGTSAGKLNESYGCGKADVTNGDTKAAEVSGQKAMAEAAKTVLGLDIHYTVHANWKVLTDVVDKVGGVTVTVEAYDGSPSLYDVATGIRYKNGETVQMDGQQALAFSRARGSMGGYGFSGGNFDRERNQQKIFKAIVEKVSSSGIANINTLMDVMDALGDNIHTSFETKELQALVDLAKDYNADNTKSLPLFNAEENFYLLKTDNISGISVVVPSAGSFDYDDIHAYIKKNLYATEATKEDAKIVILNGTTTDGLARTQKKTLEDAGLTVIEIGNTKERNYTNNIIYTADNSKPKTVEKLSEMYGVSSTTGIPDEFQSYEADIVVILGKS